MKKITFFTFLLLLTFTCFSQDYFEKKMKKIKSFDFTTLLTKGPLNFDYSKLSEKTLIVSKYDPKSIYNNLVLNKQYDGFTLLEEKEKYYESIFGKAIQESSFNACNTKIENINYEALSAEDRKKYLYLSYHQIMSYVYAVVWYVDSTNTELPLTAALINDLDLGGKNDLRFLFNLLNQSISINLNEVNRKIFADMNNTLEDKSRSKTDRLYSLSTQEVQEAYAKYFSQLVSNYLSEANYTTLLLQKEVQNVEVDKIMEQWKYSKFEFLPKAAIEEKREKLDSKYSYLRLQTVGSGLTALTMVWILSTENDRILYTYIRPLSSKDKLESIIPQLIADIEGKKTLNGTNSTLVYNQVDFKADQFPEDLKTSKLAYVNINRTQSVYATWINNSFEKKMKKYPYQYKIYDNASNLEDCKYRVYLKSFMETFKKTTTTTYADHRKQTDVDVDYVTKELFILYIQNIKTGECYKTQMEPEFYPRTFKDFVDSVNR